jgi:RNA polymerase-binding transcription factor
MSLTSDFPFASNVLLLFKSNLQGQYSELTRAIDSTHKEIRTLADSGPGDVIDEFSGSSSKEAVFATHSRNRTQFRKVEAALERLATGDFGICAACGGAIGLKRLQALPWANNCIECQEQSEQGRVQ